MGIPLKVLIVEDSEDDAILLLRELRRGGFDAASRRVETPEDFKAALDGQEWDIVIADYSLPRFSGLEALKILRAADLDLPLIVVSGAIGEDTAVDAMKAGANDYLMKGRLTRLVPAIKRELKDAVVRRSYKRLEEQLRHTQKIEAIGQLAGSVAHDFNNILTAIIGYCNLLQMKMPPEDPMRIYVKEILGSSERAANLTRSLLAFSRKQVINPKPVDLNGIVRELEKLLLRITGEEIELKMILSENRLNIFADTGQIEQVLMNLVSNAKDAMPGGGAVTINTEEVEFDEGFARLHGFGERGRYALLTVADTGTGMSREVAQRIFEPYFTTKQEGKGAGLGLSIVYGIVKQHGGHITVYSEEGRGAVFKIYIPMTESESGERAVVEEAVPQRGNETVLVAEDDPDVRRLVRSVFEEYGYKVIEAENGDEAVERFKEHAGSIDLLILDVLMPHRKGREVYEEIKGMRRDIKAIFLSGYPEQTVRKNLGIADGMNFISKPLSPNDLLKKVREVIQKK